MPKQVKEQGKVREWKLGDGIECIVYPDGATLIRYTTDQDTVDQSGVVLEKAQLRRLYQRHSSLDKD